MVVTRPLVSTISPAMIPLFTSYIVNLGGGMNFGAFYVNVGVHYGQNLGNFTVLTQLEPEPGSGNQ